MALGSTQPLTEMSTRNLLIALWTFTASYKDIFNTRLVLHKTDHDLYCNVANNHLF
jgi:hypothetical protein